MFASCSFGKPSSRHNLISCSLFSLRRSFVFLLRCGTSLSSISISSFESVSSFGSRRRVRFSAEDDVPLRLRRLYASENARGRTLEGRKRYGSPNASENTFSS